MSHHTNDQTQTAYVFKIESDRWIFVRWILFVAILHSITQLTAKQHERKKTPKSVYASIARIYMCAQCDRIDCVANRICSQLKTERRSMFRGQADRPQLHWHSNFHGGIDGIGMLWMMAVRWSTAIEHTHAGWKPSRFAWKCSGEAVAMLESFFDLQMEGPVWLSC